MKKIFITLLFCLPILRGANYLKAQDSTNCRINLGEYFFTIKNCQANTGTLTGNLYGYYRQPLTFYIDNQLVGTRNSLFIDNVKAGTHTLKVRSADGCEFVKQLTLQEKFNFYYSSFACGQGERLILYANDIPKNATVSMRTPLGEKYPQRDTGNLVWENILPGNYPVQIIDSLGCVRRDTVKLYSKGLNVSNNRVSTNCTDVSSLEYQINIANGQAPYIVINRDNGDTLKLVNDKLLLNAEGFYNISVTDSKNCRGFMTLNTYEKADSIRLFTHFVPINCTDKGKLSIFFDNPNVLRPLSMSFNGQPFSADTVFDNVAANKTYSVIVKSKQGCDLKSRVLSVYTPLSIYSQSVCANRFGKGTISPQVYGGVAPYIYSWTAANGFTTNLSNLNEIPVGIYNLTVTDAAGCSATKSFTLTTCIWSGDTDTSGVVDNNDLLNIGLAYGETGPQRLDCFRNNIISDTCLFWMLQIGAEWSKQTPTKVNYKHIDTNGDGIINNADTLAIKRNWSQTRAFKAENIAARSTSIPLFIQTNPVRENQWASFPIVLGDVTTPANGIYGLAFSINYDPLVIDASTVSFTYNQTWLGANSDLLSISRNENGHLDIGFTKINHTNSSGKGQIGTINFKLKSGVGNKPLNFSIVTPTLINNNAEIMSTNPQNTSTTITGTVEPEWASRIAVYPNPTTGQFFIETQDADIQQVMVFDVSGKRVQQFQKPNRNTPLSITQLGTFFLSIETGKGVIKRKVIRL